MLAAESILALRMLFEGVILLGTGLYLANVISTIEFTSRGIVTLGSALLNRNIPATDLIELNGVKSAQGILVLTVKKRRYVIHRPIEHLDLLIEEFRKANPSMTIGGY